MSWQGIQGHDDVIEQFRRAVRRDRLASTFLFAGPPGVGKRLFAERLAQALLCPVAGKELEPCGRCDSCVQAWSRTHPDLLIIEKPADKSDIPVALLIGEKERRMREGLCHDIALKPFMGGRKVAIIDHADHLNEEGANCLLKTLEEPPPRSVLILLGTSPERQLPTIRSRAQLVRFRPLEPDVVADILLATGLASERVEAERLSAISDGSIERALALADEALWTFRTQLLEALAAPHLASTQLASALVPFIESAGKEAPPRRARARQLISFAVEFYRQLLRVRAGADPEGDNELRRLITQAAARQPGDVETAAACIERSLEALTHIDRNAHQTTLVECWLDDLARILAGQFVDSYDVT